MKILFICKKNEVYNHYSHAKKDSGLFNSTRFIVEALQKQGISADIVEVMDNNDIDREVASFRPDAVVIEALWVVPEKFTVLKRLHPDVAWFCHLHSNIPFLATEGVAVEWLRKYADLDVKIITNCRKAYGALAVFLLREDLVFLPNVYSAQHHPPKHGEKSHLNVGCFGAIRPLKNHLIQAMASVRFADELGLPLRFHINFSRVEGGGEPILRNLRALFEDSVHELIEHPWIEPTNFVAYLRHHLDIGMQVSLSETFNIVSADYVAAGLPVVVSKEVYWISRFSQSADNSVSDMVSALSFAWKHKLLVRWNQHCLEKASCEATERWVEFANSL